MVRIQGVNLPDNKRIEVGLTYIFGIGINRARKILQTAEVDKNIKVNALAEDQLTRIRELIEKEAVVEGDLKREISLNVKRLKDIGSYRGVRHSKGLPARGQQTKTNSRTVRGNVRHTAGSGRKKSAEKT